MRDDSSYVLDKHTTAHKVLTVPIIAQEKVVRWLIVGKPADYNELDEELLETIASYMALKLTPR